MNFCSISKDICPVSTGLFKCAQLFALEANLMVFEQLCYCCFRPVQWSCSFYHMNSVLYTWFSAFVDVILCRWEVLGDGIIGGSHDIVICSLYYLLCLWLGALKNLSIATVLDFLTNCHPWIASVMCTRSCVYINIGIYTYYKCVKNNCLLFCLFFAFGCDAARTFYCFVQRLRKKKTSATTFLMLHDIL